MKNPLIFLFALLLTSVSLISCGSDSDVRENAANAVGGTTPAESPLAPAPPLDPVTTTPAPTGGVQHYTCPNNCAGSGGPSQGNCPVCGTAYQHNQAWHNQQQPAASPTTTPTTPTANSGQNAAGVWHYICNNGCPGGSGSAGSCASCGSPLAHNTAYHN